MPSEPTLIAYDELWRLYIAPKLDDQSLNTITRADVWSLTRDRTARVLESYPDREPKLGR